MILDGLRGLPDRLVGRDVQLDVTSDDLVDGGSVRRRTNGPHPLSANSTLNCDVLTVHDADLRILVSF